ncbi:hypothetical protein HYFRA_00009605 [Hymenoscyphus fraxineus]|uniref:Uncharacterized protein n=1 Tax=Hymenoscyphus fraxineus TaxID=746836 RepID=A0A9N9KZ07_9HELO|nr:hypothetical protein HYFRA_00009605 [Hymenoscyphus fraxineus]
MDGISTFPVEVTRLILLEAVQTRGLKRAVRLRFVNRWWDVEVLEAIFRCGILDKCERLCESLFWPKYLPYKIFSNETPRFRNLCVIREVAERVLEFRRELPSDDAVRECICQFATHGGGEGCNWAGYAGEIVEEGRVLDDSDDVFNRALLVAAIILNDMTLVKHQLSHMRHSPHLLSNRSWHYEMEVDPTLSVIGFPTDTAAYLGNAEALLLLFEAIPNNPPEFQLSDAREQGAECSAGSKFATFELCQDAEPRTGFSDDVICMIERTLSPEIFEYLEIVCGVFIHAPGSRVRKDPLMHRLENCFFNAVKKGDLGMMKYLVGRGVVVKEFRIEGAGYISTDDYQPTGVFEKGEKAGFLALTTYATLGGHTEALKYLLENGAKIGCRSLEAACQYGNPECVKLLLEHGATDDFNPGSALLQCVKRENESVIRQLIAYGMASVTGMNDDVKQQMLDFIEKEGLQSMSKFIQELMTMGSTQEL